MEHNFSNNELNDEQLSGITGGIKSQTAREEQIKRLEKIKAELEQNQHPQSTPIPEDELSDEELEQVKAGRTHI